MGGGLSRADGGEEGGEVKGMFVLLRKQEPRMRGTSFDPGLLLSQEHGLAG